VCGDQITPAVLRRGILSRADGCHRFQIGEFAFTELNDGKALLQSTALLLEAVPVADPDTVTLRPVVCTGKLVEPLPMIKVA